MPRYIEETEIYKLVEPHGTAKVHCSQIDELPRADVVPKSEYDAVVNAVDNSTKEFLKLHDAYQDLKRDYDILNSLIGHKEEEAYNKGYEDGKADNQSEVEVWKQNRFNLYQRLELYEMARQKVASEIFAEIEDLLKIVKIPCVNTEGCITPMRAGYWAIDPNDYAELKKKYTENIPSPAPEEKYFSP